jgi:hypothetical protein
MVVDEQHYYHRGKTYAVRRELYFYIGRKNKPALICRTRDHGDAEQRKAYGQNYQSFI